MSTMITAIGTVVTASIDWIGEFATLLVDNSVLTLLCVAIPMVGLGVGLLKRMISL